MNIKIQCGEGQTGYKPCWLQTGSDDTRHFKITRMIPGGLPVTNKMICYYPHMREHGFDGFTHLNVALNRFVYVSALRQWRRNVTWLGLGWAGGDVTEVVIHLARTTRLFWKVFNDTMNLYRHWAKYHKDKLSQWQIISRT